MRPMSNSRLRFGKFIQFFSTSCTKEWTLPVNLTEGKFRSYWEKTEARDRRIFELWLACWTRDEIAAEVGCSAGEVSAITSEMADMPKLTKSDKAAAEHATEFDVPTR